MNWLAVLIVLGIACVLGTIGAFACMMAAFEYDPFRRAIWYVPPFLAFVVVDALLAGVIW